MRAAYDVDQVRAAEEPLLRSLPDGTLMQRAATALARRCASLLGKVYGNLMVDLQVTCEKLRDRGERILVETLGLPRPRAAALLEEAAGHVKTALVMERRGVGREQAHALLDQADGVIARVVGDLGVSAPAAESGGAPRPKKGKS